MRTLAEEILTNNRSFVEELATEYPTYFDTNNLAITQDNYFLVASKYRLGTAQTNQFQSGDQYGANWHWGSKCTEAGVCDEEASVAGNTGLSEMPREYLVDTGIKGGLYNWYSATAETGKYGTSVSGVDSLCPKGWTNVSYGSASEEKTWYFVTYRNYSFTTVRQMPVSYVWVGEYRESGTFAYQDLQSNFWTRTAHSSGTVARDIHLTHDQLSSGADGKSQGNLIRCMLK